MMDRPHVRELVGWLRSTTTDSVIEEVARYLHQGESENDLWAAAALTAARYINNQAHNMLGFVSHALIGTEDARRLAATQDTRTRHKLLMQCVYQVITDRHNPCMGPFELFPAKGFREATTEANIKMLRMDARIGEYSRCDHRFTALEKDLPRDELIYLLLEIGLEGITTDDHTFISPVLCLGMIDLVGWEDGFEMLRATLRYNASFPRVFVPHDRAVGLLEQYGLVNGAPNADFDPASMDEIRRAFHAAAPEQRPELAAQFMAEGHAPTAVLAAISLVGCDLYLMADPVPHADFDAVSREVAPIHMGTCMSALQAGMKYLNPRLQALAVIRGGSQLERGPSTLNKDFEFVPFEAMHAYPYAEDVEALHGRTPDELLKALDAALKPHDYRTATAAVKAYELTGADPKPLIALMIEAACTDNLTLLHNFKHLHSMVNEFYRCKHPDRWNYLIAAVRFIAWYAGVETEVSDRIETVLDGLPSAE